MILNILSYFSSVVNYSTFERHARNHYSQSTFMFPLQIQERGLTLAIVPVSYTHLDVYKRQRKDIAKMLANEVLQRDITNCI